MNNSILPDWLGTYDIFYCFLLQSTPCSSLFPAEYGNKDKFIFGIFMQCREHGRNSRNSFCHFETCTSNLFAMQLNYKWGKIKWSFLCFETIEIVLLDSFCWESWVEGSLWGGCGGLSLWGFESEIYGIFVDFGLGFQGCLNEE